MILEIIMISSPGLRRIAQSFETDLDLQTGR